MSQQTSFTISRAPVSVRKMIQILGEPAILAGISVTTVLAGLGTWYYYSKKSK